MLELSKDIASLIETPTLPDLGPRTRPDAKSAAELNKTLDQILRASKLPSPNQQLVRALILLWHDHLDAAHVLAQDIEGPDGAFVHGIMHRREPDYGNAAYWFRRVGKHPAFAEIATQAAATPEIASNSVISSSALSRSGWDPFAFIDLCERYARSSDAIVSWLQQLQQIETRVLLEYFSHA